MLHDVNAPPRPHAVEANENALAPALYRLGRSRLPNGHASLPRISRRNIFVAATHQLFVDVDVDVDAANVVEVVEDEVTKRTKSSRSRSLLGRRRQNRRRHFVRHFDVLRRPQRRHRHSKDLGSSEAAEDADGPDGGSVQVRPLSCHSVLEAV